MLYEGSKLSNQAQFDGNPGLELTRAACIFVCSLFQEDKGALSLVLMKCGFDLTGGRFLRRSRKPFRRRFARQIEEELREIEFVNFGWESDS